MAFEASSDEDISTNANPRGRSVMRSMMTLQLVTVPKGVNNWRNSPSVMSNDKLPTYSLVAMFTVFFLLWGMFS